MLVQITPSVEKHLFEVVSEALPDAEHAQKWGRLTFTRGGDWHHWICAIASSKKTVKLVFHKGSLLDDTQGVLEGDGKYTRSLSFAERDEIDPEVLIPLLRDAAAKQTEM